MHASSLLGFAFAALALKVCVAQSPPNSAPATSNSLSVFYGKTEIEPAGITVPAADVAKPPSLALTGNQTSTYGVVMLDLSVEANGPSAPNTTLLHWILPGLSSSSKSTATTTTLLSDQAAIAPYYPPGPPANQTHTYAIYLYDMPATFSVPVDYVPYFKNLTASVYNRVGFNLTDFTERSGLGEPVAANWYLISNTTTATTSSSGAATMVSSTGAAASASSSAASAAGKGVETGVFAVVFGLAGILSNIW